MEVCAKLRSRLLSSHKGGLLSTTSLVVGTNHWTGLPEWSTGMDYCTVIFMACDKAFLLVHTIYRSFLTWPPASLATSYSVLCLTSLLDTVAHKLVKLGLRVQLLFAGVIMLTACRYHI